MTRTTDGSGHTDDWAAICRLLDQDEADLAEGRMPTVLEGALTAR